MFKLLSFNCISRSGGMRVLAAILFFPGCYSKKKLVISCLRTFITIGMKRGGASRRTPPYTCDNYSFGAVISMPALRAASSPPIKE